MNDETRIVADRLERGALHAAMLAGHTSGIGIQSFATRWLAEQFATYKSNTAARPVHGAQRPAARPPTGGPTSDQRRGAPPLRSVPAPPDGLGISERTLMFGARKSRK